MNDWQNDWQNDRPDAEPEAFDELEAIIRSAGNYVQPTEDLRPRTVEAGRWLRNDQRFLRRLGRFSLIAAVALLIVGPVMRNYLGQPASWTAPSASELLQLGLIESRRPEVGEHWGLYEAFRKVRHDQQRQLKVSTNEDISDILETR